MRYSQFDDQALVFKNGISAIDIISLKGMAKAANPYVQNDIILSSVSENIR